MGKIRQLTRSAHKHKIRSSLRACRRSAWRVPVACRRNVVFYRYSLWDGTQNLETLTADDLMGQIADEVLGDGDLRTALQRMLQRGAQLPSGRRMQGLRELLERL